MLISDPKMKVTTTDRQVMSLRSQSFYGLNELNMQVEPEIQY